MTLLRRVYLQFQVSNMIYFQGLIAQEAIGQYVNQQVLILELYFSFVTKMIIISTEFVFYGTWEINFYNQHFFTKKDNFFKFLPAWRI